VRETHQSRLLGNEKPVSGQTESIRVVDVNGVAVVYFRDLDFQPSGWEDEASKRLREELDALGDQKHWVSIILDFQGKEFIPRAAFEGLLVSLHKKTNGNLKLCNVSSVVMECFRTSRLVNLFDIYPTRDDALRGALA